jgi:hypothetical protein
VDKKQIANGWTRSDYGDDVYHFEHFPLAEAQEEQEFCDECLYVVETINWTLADEKTVHRNKYFEFNLSDAIGLAARIQIASLDVAENVVEVRPATEQEIEDYFKALPQLKAAEVVIADAQPAVGGQN